MKSLMQKVSLHPMGLRTIPIVCGTQLAMTFAASYRWIFNSFEKLGNILPQSCAWSINSKTTVARIPSKTRLGFLPCCPAKADERVLNRKNPIGVFEL